MSQTGCVTRAMRPAVFFAILLSLFAQLSPALADPGQLCRAAIARAEREAGISAGLLQAIGRVESGRPNPETGAVSPWPWTLNAEGCGHFLPTREAALAALRGMQDRGARHRRGLHAGESSPPAPSPAPRRPSTPT